MQKLKHPIFINSLAFYLVNLSDYFISLILLPFLARTILVEGIGIMGLASILGAVCVLIMEYGFSLSATREIALKDKKKNFIVSKVYSSKLLLTIPCIIICSFSAFFLPVFQKHSLIVFFTLTSSIMSGLTPLWYFQGIQKVLPFAILKISLRVLTTIPVFFFVKSIADIWLVFFLQAISSFAICLISFSWILKKVKINFISGNELIKSFYESWNTFSLSIVPPFCSMILLFWLSTQLSIESIGLLNSADRIFKALISIFGPLGQAIYPFLISQLSFNKAMAITQTKKIFYFYIILGITMSAFTILFSDRFIEFYLGKSFLGCSTILKILALSIPIIKISHILGRQWMLSIKLDKIVSRLIFLSSTFLLITTYLSFERYQILSFPISLFLSELFLLISCFMYLQNKKIGFWNKMAEKNI